MFNSPHLKVIKLLQRLMSMTHWNKLFMIKHKLKSMILNMFMFRNLNSLFHIVKNLMKMVFTMTMFNVAFLIPLFDIGKNFFITNIDLELDTKKQFHFSFQIIQNPFSFRVLDSSMKIPLPICLKVHVQIYLKLWDANIVIELVIWLLSFFIFILVCIVEIIHILQRGASCLRNL